MVKMRIIFVIIRYFLRNSFLAFRRSIYIYIYKLRFSKVQLSKLNSDYSGLPLHSRKRRTRKEKA